MSTPAKKAAGTGGVKTLGTRIGEPLIIAKRIGRGRLSDVYSASHPVLARRFAVKVFKAALTKSARAGRRLRHAVRESSVVDHPNVVSLVDFGTLDGGRLYLTMDYVRGQALTQQLKRGRPLPLDTAQPLLNQLAQALQAAHLAMVVHGDVKPNNIIVLDLPNGRRDLRLLDLRLTGALALERSEEDPVRHLRVYSTLEYLSPEVIEGHRVDPRSDVYSFGALAYRLLCGRPPFTGTAEQIVNGHREAEPRPLLQQPAAVEMPRFLESVVMQCLAKDPAERFASMAEVAGELAAMFRITAPPAEELRRGAALTPAPQPPPVPPDAAEQSGECPGLPETPAQVRALLYDSIFELAQMAAMEPNDPPEALLEELRALQGLRRELDRLRRQAEDPEARLETVRQELREREATLRYAIVDLNWTRTRLQEGGASEAEIMDVAYQVAELEGSLAKLEQQRGELLAALQQELRRSRDRMRALEQQMVPHYRRLYVAAVETRKNPTNPRARDLCRTVERCRRYLSQG